MSLETSSRLREIRKELGLSQLEIADSLGLKQGSYSDVERGKVGISGDVLKILVLKYRINPYWLYSGEGEKYIPENINKNRGKESEIKDDEKGKIKGNVAGKAEIKTYTAKEGPRPGHWTESEIKTYIKNNGKPIPFYDMESTAGPVEVFNDSQKNPSQFISIPGFDDCDFAFNLWGDSMHPIYCSGDIILCKRIKDKGVILFGEAYFIVTSELRTVKYIKKHNESHLLILEPANDFYDSFEIETHKVTHLYIVKGKVRRNAI